MHCHALSCTVMHYHALSYTVMHCHALSCTVIHCNVGRRAPARLEGPTLLRRQRGTDRPLHVAYVDDDGHEIDPDEVTFVRTAAYPA